MMNTNTKQMQIAENIRNHYTQKDATKLDELRALDKKVKRPAKTFAYIFGTVGALVLGTGMSLAMKVIGASMALGIAIGIVGLAAVSVNYFLYGKILQKRKAKYADKVLALSDEILK